MVDQRNSEQRLRITLGALISSAALLTGTTAHAFEWNGLVGLGIWQSDNETRSSTTELDETTLEPVVGLSMLHEQRTLQLNANYRAERRDFQDEVFPDRNVVTGSGSLYWEALPNRFDVRVFQNSTEATNQSFGRGDQGNRQEVRTTEASPRLRFRIRSTDELQFEYRYRDFSLERTNADSETNDLIARYQLGINELTQITFEYIEGETEYGFVGAPELDRTIFQATYRTQRQQNTVSATVGQTEFTRPGRADTDGITGNLLWTVALAERSSFSFSARRDISDGSDQFLNRGDQLDPAVPGIQLANTDLTELFELNRVRADYNFSLGATQVTLFGGVQSLDFENLPRDEERSDIGVTLQRNLRPNLNGSVNFRHVSSEFDQLTAADFDQYVLSAAVFWEPIRNFSVVFQAQYAERDGEAISGNFDETRLYAGVVYQFGTGSGVVQGIRNR